VIGVDSQTGYQYPLVLVPAQGLAWDPDLLRVQLMQQRPQSSSSSSAPPPRSGPKWRYFVEEVFRRWAVEQKEFAVRLQRRRWHRLGEILQRSTWAKEFRAKYFTPVWEMATVKRWLRR